VAGPARAMEQAVEDHQTPERNNLPTRQRDLWKECKRCHSWKRKTAYYDTCYKGINCLALASDNASAIEQGASQAPKVLRVADNTILLLQQEARDGPAVTQKLRHKPRQESVDERQEIACTRSAGQSAGEQVQGPACFEDEQAGEQAGNSPSSPPNQCLDDIASPKEHNPTSSTTVYEHSQI
jgi:hypothetical protein